MKYLKSKKGKHIDIHIWTVGLFIHYLHNIEYK